MSSSKAERTALSKGTVSNWTKKDYTGCLNWRLLEKRGSIFWGISSVFIANFWIFRVKWREELSHVTFSGAHSAQFFIIALFSVHSLQSVRFSWPHSETSISIKVNHSPIYFRFEYLISQKVNQEATLLPGSCTSEGPSTPSWGREGLPGRIHSHEWRSYPVMPTENHWSYLSNTASPPPAKHPMSLYLKPTTEQNNLILIW